MTLSTRLTQSLETIKHDAPNHERGIGFNEGVEASLAAMLAELFKPLPEGERCAIQEAIGPHIAEGVLRARTAEAGRPISLERIAQAAYSAIVGAGKESV